MFETSDERAIWECEEASQEWETRDLDRLRCRTTSFPKRIETKSYSATCKSEQSDDAQLVRSALASIGSQLQNIAREYRFRQLAATWKSDTQFMSNVTAKMIRPEYQKIIGMGEAAIPFILRDLKEEGPNDWFWALTAITDENPITEEIVGNMTAMTEAWLQWGRKAGYLTN